MPTARAQTATVYGSLGNFNTVNNTGQDACGFEVEIDGVPCDPPIQIEHEQGLVGEGELQQVVGRRRRPAHDPGGSGRFRVMPGRVHCRISLQPRHVEGATDGTFAHDHHQLIELYKSNKTYFLWHRSC